MEIDGKTQIADREAAMKKPWYFDWTDPKPLPWDIALGLAMTTAIVVASLTVLVLQHC